MNICLDRELSSWVSGIICRLTGVKCAYLFLRLGKGQHDKKAIQCPWSDLHYTPMSELCLRVVMESTYTSCSCADVDTVQ